MLTFGSQGLYQWLVTDDPQIDLLKLCPEIVLNKYVAITSIDSGVFLPGEIAKAAGWESRNQIAYSPKLKAVDQLARDGWDEWYVFTKPTDLGRSGLGENLFEVPDEPGQLRVFVNCGFALHPPETASSLAALFWRQMEWTRPESYMADNDYLTFACANQELFAAVRDAVKDQK